MEKIYSRIVRIVSIIIIGYLFLQGLFTICNMQRVTERVYYMKNNPWRQLLCIGIVILLCLAARKFKAKEFLDRYGHYVFYVCITGMVLFLLWWVSQTGFWFFGDSEKIYMCAGAFLGGDPSPWEPGGYAYMWPHQNGMILLVAFLLRFADTVQSFYVMYVILIFFYAVTIVGLYQICCLLFGKNAFTAVQGMILSTYLPYAFLVNNIYGDHIGYAFAVVAVWMAFLYRQSGKMRYSLFCGINMALAVIFKQNCLIVFVGIVVFYFMHLITDRTQGKQEKLKMTGNLIVVTVLTFTISSIPTAYISSHLQVEPGAGNTKWAHIAMGLQDTESAPGWYNTYNEATFVENNYDTHATAKVSQDNIKESLRHFAADPEYAWSFFNRKWAILWNNPTFECFTLQSNKVSNVELSPLVKSTIFDGGKINILLIAFFDVCQSVYLFGILMYLITEKKAGIGELLPFLLMIGAFVFWTFWETKCRYVLPYFLFVMPYSVIGYCNLLRQWKCKIVRASLGVIVALILLMNVSNFSIMNESMKINNDTEEYYEYIHEYNKNFMNFRY